MDTEDDYPNKNGPGGAETTDDIRMDDDDDSDNNCSICLQHLEDRTVVPTCSHEFCFDCLLVWTEQSRRCPLCSQGIGEYLIHSIRSRYDYRKHFLAPLRKNTNSSPHRNLNVSNSRQRARRRIYQPSWGLQDRDRASEELDRLERSILRRRWLYQHDLYAKHVASNAFTKYRPYPTPSQFSASQDLISRTTSFLRRELQIWEGLDVEFLTTLIISLMKSIDIRSESAVKLISEFLDMDEPYTPGGRHRNAEHFAHEVYSYVRSPYKDLFVYDDVAQYDALPGIETPSAQPRSQRDRQWRDDGRDTGGAAGPSRRSPSRSRSRSRPSSTRSLSWSPSGRRYSPSRDSHQMIPDCRSFGLQEATDSQVDQNTDASHDNWQSKGKERAITIPAVEANISELLALPNASRLGATPEAPNDSNQTSKSVTDPPNTTSNPGPSRRMSLISSVKEHLSRNTSSSSGPSRESLTRLKGTKTNATRDCDPDRSGQSVRDGTVHANPDKPPVLLARLSNAKPPALLSRLSDPCSPSIVEATSRNGQSSSESTTPSRSTFPSELSILGAARQLMESMPGRSDQSFQSQDLETSSGSSLSSLEARARLLARLNREKKQAQPVVPPGHKSVGDSSRLMAEPRVDAYPHDGIVVEDLDDLAMREAALRSQAQLRVRLQAERQLATSAYARKV